MKFRLVGDSRDSNDPEVVTKYYVRYDTIDEIIRKLSLNKEEASLMREWAEEANQGEMMTAESRQNKEWALVVAITDDGKVCQIKQETVSRLVLDKLVDPDDRPLSVAARKGKKNK